MTEKYQIKGGQIAAARALLGLNQAVLAIEANVSLPTLRRMEGSEDAASGLPNNVEAVQRVLESKGVEFIPENGGGAGVRLRQPGVPEGRKKTDKSEGGS